MSEAQSRRWIVSGRVQGVGFRYFVFKAASKTSLTGYVRNLGDGTVEAVAAGDPSELGQLEVMLRHGPPGSRVDSVTASDLAETELPDPFEIRR